jgi:predicted outer membrane lipoprotein
MTACFSLRFRLKVYSFKWVLGLPLGPAFVAATNQKKNSLESVSGGIAICVGLID